MVRLRKKSQSTTSDAAQSDAAGGRDHAPPPSDVEDVAQVLGDLPTLCTIAETATVLRVSTRKVHRLLVERRLHKFQLDAVGPQRRNRTTATRPRARDHTTTITIAIGTPRRNCTTATSNNYNVSAVTGPNSYDVKKGNRYGVSAAVNIYRRHTRRILKQQHRLQELASEDAFLAYLTLEEATNERIGHMLITVARWGFRQGRRST